MRLLDQDEAVTDVAKALSGQRRFFIDTEFESTKKQTTLSIIQLSAGSEIYLLDALRLRNWSALTPVLFSQDAEWVLHAGLQDVQLLLSAFGQTVPPKLFDTQIAWSLLSAETNVSLVYLQYKLLGVKTMKSHQADDWLRRPLPAAQLRYAASDIEHLPALYDQLAAKLIKRQRLDVLHQACVEALHPKTDVPTPLSLKSFRNAWQLEPANQAALKALVSWYNQLSPKEQTRAPQSKTLLNIAGRLPKTPAELSRIKGVPPGFARSHAAELVGILKRAVSSASSQDFERIEPEAYATFEDLLWDAWLSNLRAHVCTQKGIAPELAFPNRVFKGWKDALKEHGPSYAPQLLEGWRKTVFSDAVRAFAEDSANDPRSIAPPSD